MTDPQGISPDETSGDLATLVSSLKEQIQSGFKSLSDRLDTIEEQHHELHGAVSYIDKYLSGQVDDEEEPMDGVEEEVNPSMPPLVDEFGIACMAPDVNMLMSGPSLLPISSREVPHASGPSVSEFYTTKAGERARVTTECPPFNLSSEMLPFGIIRHPPPASTAPASTAPPSTICLDGAEDMRT